MQMILPKGRGFLPRARRISENALGLRTDVGELESAGIRLPDDRIHRLDQRAVAFLALAQRRFDAFAADGVAELRGNQARQIEQVRVFLAPLARAELEDRD